MGGPGTSAGGRFSWEARGRRWSNISAPGPKAPRACWDTPRFPYLSAFRLLVFSLSLILKGPPGATSLHQAWVGTPSVLLSFFGMFLFEFLIFHIIFWLFNDEFPCFGYRLFEHEICNDFSSILAWIVVSLLMFFRYLFRSHMQPSKPLKTIVFTMNFKDLTIPRSMMIFMIFFLTSFGNYV